MAAAPQVRTVDRTITAGPIDIGGKIYHVIGVINGDITVTADVTITQPIRETFDYDDGQLRQGQTSRRPQRRHERPGQPPRRLAHHRPTCR